MLTGTVSTGLLVVSPSRSQSVMLCLGQEGKLQDRPGKVDEEYGRPRESVCIWFRGRASFTSLPGREGP